MNDTLAMPMTLVSVPPDTQPWWMVRRSLIFALGAVVALWLTLNAQRERFDRWMVTEFPVNDAIALRIAGY